MPVVEFYVVFGPHRSRRTSPVVKRSSQKCPRLYSGERCVKVALTVPPDFLPNVYQRAAAVVECGAAPTIAKAEAVE